MNNIPNTSMQVIEINQTYSLDVQDICGIQDMHKFVFYPNGRMYGWLHATYPRYTFSNTIGNVVFAGTGQLSVVPMDIEQ